MSSLKKPFKKYKVLYGNYRFQNENTITTNNEVYWLYNMVARHTAPFCKWKFATESKAFPLFFSCRRYLWYQKKPKCFQITLSHKLWVLASALAQSDISKSFLTWLFFIFHNLFPVFQYLAHKRIKGAFNADRSSGEWIHLEDVEVSKLNIKSIPFFPVAISLHLILILVAW